jgi:hypothetical protein
MRDNTLWDPMYVGHWERHYHRFCLRLQKTLNPLKAQAYIKMTGVWY